MNKVFLSDVCTLTPGFAFKAQHFNDSDDKVIKITNITPPTVDMTNLSGVDISNYKKDTLSKFIAKTGDYVLAMTGATIGKLGMIKSGTAYVNQRVLLFKPLENKINKSFLFYVLSHPTFNKYIFNHIDSETAQPNISATSVGKYEFDLPDIDVQKKIAGVLSALDDKIELNNQINSNLEQQAQALFKSWFIDFEPFGGKMPNDWEVIKFEKLANFIPGYSYKSSELSKSNCAMVTIKNFNRNGGFKIDGLKEILPSQKLKNEQKAKIFDILVAHTDLTQNAEIIGNAEMILNTGKYSELIFSMDLVKVSPKSNLSAFLILLLLKNKYFKSHCLGYVNGTTVLHLNKSALPEYKLAFPKNINCLNILNNVVENIYKNIAKNNNENQRLSEIRDSLLPKLMSGEIDVSKVDIEQIINNKD